jgi:starvation-inducible outer membrane lipoprotein
MKKLYLLLALGVMLSGCFMAPMALIGPAASGFSTASLVQSGITTGANYMVKKSTGRTITEHALDQITKDTLQQTYFPKSANLGIITAP